jgi:lipid II:glycine glycyltransferase (peptidoglycan interpeptide bridge formation enzyme)
LRILPGNANRPATVAALREALLRRCAPATFDHGESYRTVMLDLRPSLDTLRRGLDQKWRNQLNRAERNGLRVYRDCGSRALSAFAGIYRQMLERKRFVAPGLDSYARMQTALPQRQKLQVFVCEEAGHPVAGLVLATVGATGTYILGATNDLGMRCKGAYLLQWRAIEYMKEQGLEQYDLGGINVRANPGVAHFKRGLGGVEWDYLTPFVDCRNPASGLAADALRMIKHLRTRPGAPQAVASSH